METEKSCKIGFAITGSFCTHEKIKGIIREMTKDGMDIIPIFSENVQTIDCRFGKAEVFMEEIEKITGHTGIRSIQAAEPIGPNGNSMAKLCNGITDTPVLMAAKAHLRNERPLILAVSTNDALGVNFQNLGMLANMKNIYLVPFGQDNYEKKPKSMIAHVELIPDTIKEALQGRQLQPMVRSPF